MNISVEEEEEQEGNKCCDKRFDDEVLDLIRKRKREISLEKINKIQFMVGYIKRKLNVLTSNYQFLPTT